MSAPKDPIKREEWIQKISYTKKGIPRSEETRRKLSEAKKGEYTKEKNPFYGKRHSDESRQKMSIAKRGEKHPFYGKPRSEETRTKMSDAAKGEKNHNYGKSPSEEHRRKISDANKGKRHSEASRKKMSDAMTLGVTEKPYCWKNRNVAERVRTFFNNSCVLCGTPQTQNVRKHVHHHVYYDKKACCLISENGTYYSNLGLKYNPFPFKIIGDPNKFVLLCERCHNKTGGKLHTREKWARYFETMINDYYRGKSYLTTDEMIALQTP